MKHFAAFALLLLTSITAHATTNLAILGQPSCAHLNVSAGCPNQTYGTPDSASVVRTAKSLTPATWGEPGYDWMYMRDLPTGAPVEVCKDDVPEGSPNVEGNCRNWGFVPKPASGWGGAGGGGPTPPVLTLADWVATWIPPTKNEDGSALTDLRSYRIENAPVLGGPWVALATVPAPATTATLKAAFGTQCFRMFATNSAPTDSQPSGSVCSTRAQPAGPAPYAPVLLASGTPTDLSLFDGIAAGVRPVYAKTATGTRGAKIGDMTVGPTTQGAVPVNRVKCSPTDTLTSGATMYYRVIDTRVPTQYQAGYAVGCKRYGVQ